MKITGNEPANPVASDKAMENMSNSHYNGLNACTNPLGLTIRQQFAMAAMQGLASGIRPMEELDCEWLSKASVNVADALISKLNETAQ